MNVQETPTITAVEIGRLAGVGRSAVSNWRKRHADFPAPVGRTGPADFDLGQVGQWLHDRGKFPSWPAPTGCGATSPPQASHPPPGGPPSVAGSSASLAAPSSTEPPVQAPRSARRPRRSDLGHTSSRPTRRPHPPRRIVAGHGREVCTGDSLRAGAFASRTVVCHPPFGTSNWNDEELGHDPRWIVGITPRTELEPAWAQHASPMPRRHGGSR